MILVTGATGNLGSNVVHQLLNIGHSNQFIVSSSNENGVATLKEKGFNARLANFSDATTLNEAFQGIDKLLLISTMDQNRFEQHKNVVDAAKEQGVKHIIYTGLAIKDINTSGVKDLMISHFQTEDYIKESGLTYTFVRNTMYADALIQILGPQVFEQGINLPGGNGKVPYALRREMGEAIANLLLQDGHDYKIYNITGNKSLGYAEIAEALSKLSGKSIDYNIVLEDEFINKLRQSGFPEFLIYLHVGTIYDIKTHQYEIESNDLEKILGRPTADINTFLKELFNI